MGLSSALDAALSGLTTTQAQIEVISQNVSNQGSVGYTRRQATLVQQVTAGNTTGVQVASIQRILDTVVQSQLRTETSAAAYTSVQNENFAQIDQIFGQPGSSGSLDAAVNAFTTALQALSNDPGNSITRNGVISAAQALAQRLSGISTDIQTQRDGIEAHLADDVNTVNGILSNLQDLNNKIIGLGSTQASAALLDQRDKQISELSKYVDVSVSSTANNGVRITTTGGLPLLDINASKFKYDQHYVLNATSQYSTDPLVRGVGTVTLLSPNGGAGIDVLANGSIRSGEIAGLVNLRDKQLVQAQAQVDELAAGLSNAVANNQVAGAPVANGFNVDLTNYPIQPGNEVTIDYTVGGINKRITIKRVDDTTITPPNLYDAQKLAELNESTVNNRVIALDFSGGVAGALAQLATKIGAGTEAPLPAGISLTSPGANQIQAVSTTPATLTIGKVNGSITSTALSGQDVALPLFIDTQTGKPYTGSFEGSVDQTNGLAQRLALNPAVINNPGSLVVYTNASGVTTLAGDAKRPNFLIDQLTKANQAFSPLGGIGSNGAPFDGTVVDFAKNVVQNQSGRVIDAKNIDDGQQIVLKSIQKTFSDNSGVNIDQELAHLIEVQNAYSANARLISTVKELFTTLLQI
ncbi:MAG: flagellar hook-associated protein FlgK [Beijerinckiaceae bacterium]|nr:flagellar hook-associated protein FlgK [Beijerinckiaceae bacterium]